jgi:hypothetical protein
MDLRQIVIPRDCLRSVSFGNPGSLGSDRHSDIRRGCLSEALRDVPRSNREPGAFAGLLAENTGDANPPDAGFWIDDGRGLPNET